MNFYGIKIEEAKRNSLCQGAKMASPIWEQVENWYKVRLEKCVGSLRLLNEHSEQWKIIHYTVLTKEVIHFNLYFRKTTMPAIRMDLEV